jgi:hypothetical protein
MTDWNKYYEQKLTERVLPQLKDLTAAKDQKNLEITRQKEFLVEIITEIDTLDKAYAESINESVAGKDIAKAHGAGEILAKKKALIETKELCEEKLSALNEEFRKCTRKLTDGCHHAIMTLYNELYPEFEEAAEPLKAMKEGYRKSLYNLQMSLGVDHIRSKHGDFSIEI